jgi:integrase
MTLGEFFTAFFLPVVLQVRRAATRNITQYRESLALWKLYTSDPPLRFVDDFVIAQFLQGLASRPGKSGAERIGDNTVRKHVFHVQTVLDKCGPKSRKNRDAQKILDEVPWISKPPAVDKIADDNFTIAELGKILDHCHVARAPLPLSQEQRTRYWVNLFLFAYNTGLRIGSLMALEWPMVQGQQILLPARTAVKGRQNKRFPLNTPAAQALEEMRKISAACMAKNFGTPGRVWPWRGWPSSQSWLQAKRKDILAAAGIPKERRFGFHGCRKAMCSESAAISAIGGSMAAGHKDMKTTMASYVNPKIIADTLAQLPQPPRRDGQQMNLF